MKLNYFYGSIAIILRDGYDETLEFSTTKQSGKLEFRCPYCNITPEQAEAISQFTKTVTDAYNVLQSQINRINKKLKLEEYAPVLNPEELLPDASPESVPSQPLHGVSDPTDLVEHSQQEQERLDMEELGTGADGDIDKPKHEVVITKVTEEDSW